MSRTPFVCGNWKLHKTVAESIELATAIKNAVGPVRDVEVAVAPVFTSLHAVAKRLEGSSVGVAGQDCFWEDQGAWTGEVSAKMLKDVGCTWVIIGHSERRQHFGELDAAVNLKVKGALRNGLKPIVCVGETQAEREQGRALAVVRTQLDGSIPDAATPDNLVVAYEPVWAIGSGLTPTGADVAEMHGSIRRLLCSRFAEEGAGMRILYGGSVKPDNIA